MFCSTVSVPHQSSDDAYLISLYTTDLYGRGYSEAAEGPQDPNLYILQLALLMQYVKWDAADIVGFSMV